MGSDRISTQNAIADEVTDSMRRAYVYASITAQQHIELMNALHGLWRTATRMVIVVPAASEWTASEIADLLAYDPKTVRAWITRHQAEGLASLPDRPRPGRPRKGSPGPANASAPCCTPDRGPPRASGKPSAAPS